MERRAQCRRWEEGCSVLRLVTLALAWVAIATAYVGVYLGEPLLARAMYNVISEVGSMQTIEFEPLFDAFAVVIGMPMIIFIIVTPQLHGARSSVRKAVEWVKEQFKQDY